MADNPQTPTLSRGQRSSTLKTTYLVLYNFVSSILWSTILGRVLLIAAVHGTADVYTGVGQFAKWTQTLALAEVLHAAFGRFGHLSVFSEVVQEAEEQEGCRVPHWKMRKWFREREKERGRGLYMGRPTEILLYRKGPLTSIQSSLN